MDGTAWLMDLQRERAWRDALYTGPETPLSGDARATFTGLKWFPIDPSYRLVGQKLWRHKVPIPGRLEATGPDAMKLDEVGAFTFDLEGVACRLLAFSPAPGEADEDYLLVPFRDETSGKETYGAGRYLDLEPNASDVYELDFNRVYHPYCAHDDRWSCTLPPPQNRLAVRVEAGERL